jgi:hypothetical protein
MVSISVVTGVSLQLLGSGALNDPQLGRGLIQYDDPEHVQVTAHKITEFCLMSRKMPDTQKTVKNNTCEFRWL